MRSRGVGRRSGAEVPAPAARAFGELVRRRLRREPVAYILGRKGFRGIELAVDRRVLIPRPETELLVEVALERAPARCSTSAPAPGRSRWRSPTSCRNCEVVATDTSAGALEVARANAERLGSGRPRSLRRRHPARRREAFDLILANLPYVAERDWPSLQPEVTQWEPREALLAGPDGLDAIRACSPIAVDFRPLCGKKLDRNRAGGGGGAGGGGRQAAQRRRLRRDRRSAATWPGSSGW